MSQTIESFKLLLENAFSEPLTYLEASQLLTIKVQENQLFATLKTLKETLKFDALIDHAGVDWPNENKIELIYILFSTHHNQQIMVSADIDRNQPTPPSVSSLWAIAEWQEREVFDLLGVTYKNHPDLRRLFLEDNWVGSPLRKDYKDDFILERPW